MQLYYNSSDHFIKKIILGCVTLQEKYRPTWFCLLSPWVNVLVMLIKEKLAPKMEIKRDTIICPDGGEISIDWANDEVTRSLPQDAPVLGILHTITGSTRQNAGFMHYAAKRGWRSCVLNRRGHSGMPLRVIPHFSIMGNIDDTVIMVDKIREKYPDNFVGLAGISAGSGQVVSYIGREGDKAKINVAASLCPAWDISSAFQKLHNTHPWLDRYITTGIINHFIRVPQNRAALASMPEATARAEKATNLGEFMDAAAPLAGCKDIEMYYDENNPMKFFTGNKKPCLVLNALDDFLCLKENIRYDVKDQVHNYVLAITEHGSHIAYNEGWMAGGNFMWRVTLDFFETVKHIQ